MPLYGLATLGIAALASFVPMAMSNLNLTAERVALSLSFVAHRDPAGAIQWAFLVLSLRAYAALESTKTTAGAEDWRAVLCGAPTLLIVAGTLAVEPGRMARCRRKFSEKAY